jgi:hypothetical protein
MAGLAPGENVESLAEVRVHIKFVYWEIVDRRRVFPIIIWHGWLGS